MSVFRDERGELSGARVFLASVLAATVRFIEVDAKSATYNVPSEAYALLGGAITGLIIWAAGPRIAQYVGAQWGAVVAGISGAAGRIVDRVKGLAKHEDKPSNVRPEDVL